MSERSASGIAVHQEFHALQTVVPQDAHRRGAEPAPLRGAGSRTLTLFGTLPAIRMLGRRWRIASGCVSVLDVLSGERGFAGVGVVFAWCDADQVEEVLAFGAGSAAGHDE